VKHYIQESPAPISKGTSAIILQLGTLLFFSRFFVTQHKYAVNCSNVEVHNSNCTTIMRIKKKKRKPLCSLCTSDFLYSRQWLVTIHRIETLLSPNPEYQFCNFGSELYHKTLNVRAPFTSRISRAKENHEIKGCEHRYYTNSN